MSMSLCWQCGGAFNRRHDGTPIFVEIEVDEVARQVHVVCSRSVQQAETAARVTCQLSDEVPQQIQRYPEETYG